VEGVRTGCDGKRACWLAGLACWLGCLGWLGGVCVGAWVVLGGE